MTVTHTGSTEKFAAGWQRIFGGPVRGKSTAKPSGSRRAKASGKQRRK